jgi:CPA1 family monovalent cation:H+ antiporter
MTVFQIISILISLTALFSYLNFRFFKLPATIGVMLTLALAMGFTRWRCPCPQAASREREIVLAVTYVIVIFSILVQGLSLKHVVKALVKQ